MNKSDSKSSLEIQIKSMLNNVMDDELKEDENEEHFKFSDEEDTQDNNSSNTIFNQMKVNNNIDFNMNFFQNNKNLNNSDYIGNINNNFVRKYPRKSLTLTNQNSQSNNLEKSNYFQTQILHKPFSFNGNYFPKNSQFMFPNYFNSQIENQNNISFNSTEIRNNNNDIRTVNRKKTFEIKSDKFINNQNNAKKFGSVTLPKDINVKVEMILFEIKKIITKTNKIDYLIYSKLQGNFINVIKSHKGSRIFQNYLKNTHSDILHQILMEILPNLKDLIIDPYANYFCRKFFTYLNQKDRNEYLNAIKDNLIELCCNNIGTYPIQGIIEYIGSKTEKNLIINSIKNYITKLAYDPYGCHVLEKIISSFEEDLIVFIYDFILNNFLDLSYNSNGICVIKKVITFIHKYKFQEQIKKIIKENAMDLIKHSYGNYVFQVLINYWNEDEVIKTLYLFKNKLTMLSMEKYASNVMERWIEKSDKILSYYIYEIVQSGKIGEIMKNNFGNYVIQKALKIATGENEKILINEVNNNIYKLNDKKLIEKWRNIILPHFEKLK